MRTIKGLKTKNRIFLAPMLEPNDIAFRLLCKKEGAGLTYTGMINAQSKQQLQLEDKPALQLFGNTPKGIKEFIQKHDKKVSLWDFNLGCPSKLSKKLAHGAFMHKDFDNIKKILQTMRTTTKKPISIKLRKSPQALDIITLAEPYVNAIGIHPRTSEEGYSGTPDKEYAKKVRRTTKHPVIYSGNITEKNYQEYLKEFDYLHIGRQTIGKPQLFATLNNKKPKTTFEDYIKLAKQYNIPFRNIKYHAMNHTKGKTKARKQRLEIMKAKTITEIEKAMKTHK
jgi:tRNA-dihydrouridine synthase B